MSQSVSINKLPQGAANTLLGGNGSGTAPSFQTGTKRLQRVVQYIGTRVAFTGSIPTDNTIPQITEGAQVLSQSFTPLSASSTLIVHVSCPFGQDGSTGAAYVSSFFDTGASTTDAQRAMTTCSNSAGTHAHYHGYDYQVASGSTAARTFSVRFGGASTSLSGSVNGYAAAQQFGGAGDLMISIEEWI